MDHRILQITMIGLLAGGLGLLVVSAGGFDQLATLPPKQLTAAGLLTAAAAAGLLAVMSLQSDSRRLAEAVKTFQAGGRGGTLEAPRRDFVPLVNAVNELVRSAHQTVLDASLKVKELEIQLKVADAERQHAEAIIYSISDAVLVTDPFDEVVLANESAARTFDFDLSDATRAPVDQVLRDPKMIDLIRDMRQSEGLAGRRVVEHRVRTQQGDRTYKVTLSCVNESHSSAGGAAGVVVVLHDMTREKEVSQIKNDFVSHVSHELRTPLASIKAYVEMLIDGEATDEKTQHEFYEVIQNEANRLNRLIDNILNISRIESGLVQINKQPLSLTTVIADALEVIAPQARTKEIRIDEQLTPVFYQVQADRDMLYQAVMNLLSNAVKYTPHGGTITVQALVDEEAGRVVARITDTGVGIPPKDLPFVFDKFFRAEANNRMAKGTGLGLSLVKHIVESVHHGRIFVESEVGRGSCFGFELDLCR
jgi:two-component system, OmpR family, phosphate regulon sensor histidine kinase PhoR